MPGLKCLAANDDVWPDAGAFPIGSNMLYDIRLRPDRSWQLVAYPYSVKFARPGELKSFRHVDMNIAIYHVPG